MAWTSALARLRALRAFVTMTIALGIVGVNAGPATAGGLALSIDQWNVNQGTGVVSAAFTLTATGAKGPEEPCASYCTWRIEGWYRDGTTEQYIRPLASGEQYNTDSFTVRPALSETRLQEITHVRATLMPNYTGPWKTYTTDWHKVSDPYPDGNLLLTINRWETNLATGNTSYDVEFGWTGAAQFDGPCRGYCSWEVRPYYKDGTTEIAQGGPISQGTMYQSGTWSHSVPLGGTLTREVTHLKATLFPYNELTSPKAYVKWFPVSAPYPSGSVDLDVTKWKVNPETGTVEYDLSLSFAGAGQANGPCEGRCFYDIETWSGTSRRPTLYSTDCLSGCWSRSIRVTAPAATVGNVTHVRAHVYPSWCDTPCTKESYEDVHAVSTYVYKNHDMARSETRLGPVIASNGLFFCDHFLLQAGTHYMRSTLTDQYLACVAVTGGAAYTAVRLLETMVDAGDGVTIDFVGEEATKPFPRPTETPMLPPPTEWKDETGCEQEIPEWSVELIEGHIEERHGYSSTEEVGRWGFGVPWKSLVFPYAMKYKAVPQSDHASTCKRVIDYGHVVGYEIVFDPVTGDKLRNPVTGAPEYRLTTKYTVLTDMLSGVLVTAFPGVPREDQ